MNQAAIPEVFPKEKLAVIILSNGGSGHRSMEVNIRVMFGHGIYQISIY